MPYLAAYLLSIVYMSVPSPFFRKHLKDWIMSQSCIIRNLQNCTASQSKQTSQYLICFRIVNFFTAFVHKKLRTGISIADAAKRAGHARPDVTLRIYSHALKKNALHCCEAVTKVMPKRPKREAG